jgi:heat shock protein HtpX
MWEAIARNRRRSRVLIGLMGGILVVLGFLIGSVVDPEAGGVIGAGVALIYWVILLAIALLGGDQALLMGARARPISKEDSPRLWNVVEEMTIAASLPKMPGVYIIDQDSPNAFAAGPRPDKAVIAVTSGLLKRLDRDELQGVVAHEIAHIKNLDVRFITIAVVTVASITIISDMFLRSMWFGAGRRRSAKIDARAQLIILAVTVVAAILAPICARLLYLASSRRREYLADASAARFTRYPEGLASALEKIALHLGPPKSVNRALAPLYIINPLRAQGMFSTHPPAEERIKILRRMAGGVGYVDYERAFRKVSGGSCIGKTTLESEGSVAAREATPETDSKQEMIERIREVDGLMGRLADLLLIPCVCGVQIRVPSGLRRSQVRCPRCGREHATPSAQSAETAATKGPKAALTFERTGEGWESFKCACDKVIQLSPAFASTSMRCPSCGREIRIEGRVVPSETAAETPYE